jgi:uncharacterized protein YrrD
MDTMTEDRGAPMSYLTLEPGTPVIASDGTTVGTVRHVLADPDADIFDGLVIDASVGAGGHRFVDAPHVDHIADGGVVLALDTAAAERLPQPRASPAEMRAAPDDAAEGELARKLRRAWDLISGRY